MVYLWPHLREQIDSKKTPEEIYMILQSVTDSRIIYLYSDAEFHGRVYPLNFRITHTPSPYYRNAFKAVLTGNLIEKEGGTAIEVTLQMHIDTRIFMTIWNVIVCFAFLLFILAAITGDVEPIALLMPLFLVSGGQVFPRCSFYGSAKKALKKLKELLC